jgi:hypothetical protein
VAAIACGSTVTTSETSGSGGSSSTTNPNSNASVNATSGPGGGGACSGFGDASGTDAMTVSFRNDSGQLIYLEGGCIQPYYQIVNVDNVSDEVDYAYENSCLNTCHTLQTEGPLLCEPCGPLIYRIEPGKSIEVVWDGTGLMQRTMPLECWHESFQGNPNICRQMIAATPGTYRFSAVAYEKCRDCMCDKNGVCSGVPGGLDGISDSVKADFPNEKVVIVPFGSCTFGCP